MQKIFSFVGSFAALLALVSNTAAYADACGPLKIVASVDLRMAADDRAALVPVTLQGQTRYMLLDTGGVMSFIAPGTVAELGLESVKNSRLRFYDVKGNFVDHTTIVPDFGIGDLKGHNVEFVVSSPDFAGNKDVAGILGPGILRFYDVALDVANRKLTLLSQDHCEGKVIYWKADAVVAIPMEVARASGHIVVPVLLDGHRLNAMIDTGATNSVLNLNVAESDFGLRPKSGPGMAIVGSLGDRGSSIIYQHTFKSLNFEGLAVANPAIDIIPDLEHGQIGRPPPTGTRINDPGAEQGLPDMMIGMDILRHLHLYVAYKEQKLYITPASPSVAAPSAPAAPARPAAPAASAPAH